MSRPDGPPGLPGKSIKLPRVQFNSPHSLATFSSTSSSAASTPRKRGPAIALDTDVSRHRPAADPEEVLPPASSAALQKQLQLAAKKKHIPAPLDLDNGLSPFDRYVPIALSNKASANRRSTAAERLNRFSRGVQNRHHVPPKTPTIVVTPTADPRLTQASRARATSSVYSRALFNLLSPRNNPKTISDASSFHCRGLESSDDHHASIHPRYADKSHLPSADDYLSPSSATREPSSASSVTSRYYRASLDTIRRSEGWWDYIRTPFTARPTVLESISEPSRAEKELPDTPILANPAPMPNSRGLDDHDSSDLDLDLTPLFEEGKERRVLMHGEAAKYFDPSYDLSTPRFRNSKDITNGELRELSQTALLQQQICREQLKDGFEDSSDDETEFEESPAQDDGSRSVDEDVKPATRGQLHPREALSPSPTSPAFSPQLGVASLARVHSAKTVRRPASHMTGTSISKQPAAPAQALLAPTPASIPQPPALPRSQPHLEPALSFAEDHSDARTSMASFKTRTSDAVTLDPVHTRAATFYDLTGSQPTPRANAAMKRSASPAPPLPPIPPIKDNHVGKFRETGIFSPVAEQNEKRFHFPIVREEEVPSTDSGSKSYFESFTACLKKRKPQSTVQKQPSRKSLYVFGGVALSLAAFVLFVILLALFVVQKHVDMPVQAKWMNLTGYPPLPTGIMTVAGTNNTKQEQECVAFENSWSCALPNGGSAVNAPTSDLTPNFRFEIRFRNGTVGNNMTQILTRRASGTLKARDTFADLIYTPNPAAPSAKDQAFLGNTTDGITGPNFAGEATPFFITLLQANQTSTVSASSTSTGTSEYNNNGNGSVSASSITIKLPLPLVNDDGTAAEGILYPLVSAQPLRLYNRGADDEHYGFYTYFDRTLLVSLPTNITTIQSNSSAAAGPNAQCTWTQTRFLVKIWTRKATVSSLDGSAPSNGTASAMDFGGHGTFPYQISASLDRHGGDSQHKGVFCYGLNDKAVPNLNQQVVLDEDRAFGGSLINHVLTPFTKPAKGWAGVDGGSGGCGCEWDNA